MTLVAPAAVALAFLLDAAAGEPPTRVHPVAWFGRFVRPLDRDWRHPYLVGGACAVCLPLAAALVTGGLVLLATTGHPALGAVAAGVVLFSTTSLRMLLDEARTVVHETDTNLDAAREHLRALAGRDASALSPGQVRSAAVESASENLADGLVAPLLAFALGALVSLPVAAGAAAWVKAVNTLDSMLGYREKRVGTASARLDDAVMWVPARASALLLAVAGHRPGALAAAGGHATRPASPNSGWPMATLAALLSVRLEKPGAYDLALGDAHPSVADGDRALALVRRSGVLAYLLAGLGVVLWS